MRKNNAKNENMLNDEEIKLRNTKFELYFLKTIFEELKKEENSYE